MVAFVHCHVAAAFDEAYLNQLIERADQLNLADHPQWHALLHYRSNRLLPGVTSLIDDPLFFLSPQGKTDPRAEMEATLRRFASDDILASKEEPAQCAFAARYEWLNRQLGFDEGRLLRQACLRFDEWVGRIEPHTLTLVFPAAHLNNPSSMFGHTLLRFDTAAQTEQTRLLAYTANYAAVTGEDNGVAFAIKGLFGFYPGYASIAPYYEKTKQYSDLENRDIWEYTLRLTPEEVSRVLMHIWELRGIYSDYYFFTENCSYELMLLLDAARPELRLRDQFGYWVIPVDTVRVLYQNDLISGAEYRPAAGTKLRYRANALPVPQQDMIRRIADGDVRYDDERVRALAPADRASVYALTYDYLRYELAGRRKSRDEILDVSRTVLEARSALGEAAVDDMDPPVPPRPEHGHPTTLIEAGIGRAAGIDNLSLRWRPAFHDLYAPEEGYVRGAQIEFLDTVFSYRPESASWRLDELTFIDIVSATPRTQLFKPLSWLVSAGLTRPPLPEYADRRHLTFQFDVGAGFAKDFTESTFGFGFMKFVFDANSDLDKDYAAGVAIDGGAVASVTHNWKAGFRGFASAYGVGEDFARFGVELDQRLVIDRANHVRLLYRHSRVDDQHDRESMLAWSYYF